MKLNISYPQTGCQKCIEIDDEKKLHALYDKRMSQEVEGEVLGDQFKGYVFKITGGNDKQGFSMKQGVLVAGRVRLLLGKDTTCYRPRRTGERKRKTIRGCIVGPDLSVIHLVVVKKGEEEVPGLTDKYIPRRLGPKRASKIRKLFNLSKQDDVRKFTIRRQITPKKEGRKVYTKAPKIQRLVTPVVLQRKRHRLALKKKRTLKSKQEAGDYAKLLAQRNKERKEKRAQSLSKRRSQRTSVKAEKPIEKKTEKPEKKTEKTQKKTEKTEKRPEKTTEKKTTEKKTTEKKPAVKRMGKKTVKTEKSGKTQKKTPTTKKA